MMKSLNDVLENAQKLPEKVIAVAQAADDDILQTAQEAIRLKLARFILIGNKKEITAMIQEKNYALPGTEMIDCIGEKECAYEAVRLVRSGIAHMPMKGLLPTAVFMREVLNKETGLTSGGLISQITVTDRNDGQGLHFISDCAMNISPDLKEKKQIIENAVGVAHVLGYPCPRVALLTALETVNEAMPETLDAAILSKMNDRGQIRGCIVDGPFALDNAISQVSAKRKGIVGAVAGNADILIASDIRMGNVLHKAITYIANKQVASVIAGTSAPLIMTSRSDSVQDKLISIALSGLLVTKEA